jgi:hypothetical protein
MHVAEALLRNMKVSYMCVEYESEVDAMTWYRCPQCKMLTVITPQMEWDATQKTLINGQHPNLWKNVENKSQLHTSDG